MLGLEDDEVASRLVEQAVLKFVERRRQLREARDLEILNRSADRLNRETEDVLATRSNREARRSLSRPTSR